jgi:hypothetical protein
MRAILMVAVCAVLFGCAAQNAPRSRERLAGEVHAPLPHALGDDVSMFEDEPTTEGDRDCARKSGEAFRDCAGAMYSQARYRAMVRTCDVAIRSAKSDADRASASDVCVGLLPPALWIANARPEAVTVLTAACEKTPEDARIERAAHATVVTLHGLEHGALAMDDKRHSMRDAIVAFAAACEVDAKRTAARAVAMEHGTIATLR